MGLPARLAHDGVVGRLDPLAGVPERTETGPLVLAVGAGERGVKRGDDPLELFAGEAVAGDDELALRGRPSVAFVLPRCVPKLFAGKVLLLSVVL